jgi:Mu transposase, C-terminal domain
VVGVERWAEIRRMSEVENRGIREIARLTGHDRNTVRRALRREGPPAYRRQGRPSKLDPFKEEIHRLLRAHPAIPGKRLRELIEELGYEGGKTILDDYLREVRPLFLAKRTYQRTIYRPGELLQFDLFEPRSEIPVGFGQTRRGWVVTCCLGWSKAGAGALVFSKQAPDLLWGMGRCLERLGGLPETLVWDREGAIHATKGRPTDEFAAFCGQLPVGWRILEAADPEAKGLLERRHRFMRTNFEPARPIASPEHYQDELDAWAERVDRRTHRGIRAVPAERLEEELRRMRPLPAELPDVDRRFVIRVPQQPYLRFDTNDYSLDPRFAGRRVEVRVSQRELAATVLDTGEPAARHRRAFAKHLTFTAPTHRQALGQLRGSRRRGPKVEVEARPLDRYDALIPA